MNKNMFYEENRNLEEEDMGYDSPLYKITVFDKPFLISVGKERKLLTKKNHYFFPVYLMNKMNVQTQIGAFEFESTKENQTERLKPYLDSSGDLDLNRLGDIIFYSFADYDYFHDITLDITPAVLAEMETKYAMDQTNDIQDVEENQEEREPEPFELGEEDIKQSAAIHQTETVLKEGVFEIDKNVKRPVLLPEETREQSAKNKKEYVERKQSTWVEKFMKNSHYDIVETDNNGDCLFDTVRVAYEQMGYKTTIKKLRALVAKEADDEIYVEYRELYQGFLGEKESIAKEMRRLVTVNKELKKRLKNVTATGSSAAVEKEQRAAIIKEANEIAEQHKDLKEKAIENNHLLDEFTFMKGVDTLEQLHEVIQTSGYWADNWAITILERELNMKLIVLSELAYDETDLNNVLQCTLSGSHKKPADFTPDFYIFTTYSGNHYRLITYKNKRIFKFQEIPYDVKIMVVIKCMERNSGVFNKIQDFRNFKSKLGVDTEVEINDSVGQDEDVLNEHDGEPVFCFYNKSNGKVKAGKGANESISRNKVNEYSDLNLKKNYDWRKKLDDEWATIFTVDNMKWKTVEHYYQAAKFKKHNPHFYKLFSLDSDNEIAKDVELAKSAGSQKGAYKKGKTLVQLRPLDVKIDADFYGNRQYEEREKALHSKFSQNADLKHILLLTNNAVLKQYVPKSAPEIDSGLMKVRKQIQIE